MTRLAKLRLMVVLAVLIVGGLVAWQWYRAANAPVSSAGQETFSAARLAADKAYNAENWEIAAARFGEVATADPWNGYAWFYRGDSLMHLIAATRPAGMPVAGEGPAATPVDERTRQREEWIADALAAFQASGETWYLNDFSRYHIARLYCESGDQAAALRLLEELYATRRREINYNVRNDFSTMSDLPGFREFIERHGIGSH
jgi:tetratricopeptide (TPR) repeat protein